MIIKQLIKEIKISRPVRLQISAKTHENKRERIPKVWHKSVGYYPLLKFTVILPIIV